MEQSQSQARNTSLNDTEDDQDINDVQFEKFSSPTFNIHIHVPHYDSSTSKFYLPKIQPIINLHFDELAKRLESSRNVRSEKFCYKTFQDLITKVSPKFGVVKFHFKTNSEQKDIESYNVNNVTPNSSQRHSIDIRPNQKKNSKEARNVITKTNKRIVINSRNKNTDKNKVNRSNSKNHKCNSHAPKSYKVDKDIKLKKAIVVLTDICKTKNYSHFLEKNGSCKNQSNNNEYSYTFANKLENNHNTQKYEAGIHSANTKNENCTSISFTLEEVNNSFNISENHCTDNSINFQAKNHINDKLDIKKINNGSQNFTALVEGWSFSDILNRFQVKCNEKLDKCVAPSIGIIENKSSNYGMNDVKLSHESSKEIEENIHTEKEEKDLENEPDNDNKLYREINKNEIGINERDCFDENMSETTESFSYQQYQNETVNDFLTSELDVLSKDSLKKCKTISKDIKRQKFASDSVDFDSDEYEINSGKEVSLNNILNGEIETHDLSSVGSGAIQENKSEVPETNNSSFLDVTNPEFHLKLIKKEMKRRAFGSPASDKMPENLKSEKSDVESSPSGSTSSSKKMKLPNKRPEGSQHRTKQSSHSEDFILLNSSGSTEFHVTSLNEVKPLQCEAKDFKRKMLFGDRVTRFSRSDQLRVYKLKQEAAVKRGNSENH